MAVDVGRTTRIILLLIVSIAGQIKVTTPYVTRGGGNILSGMLPPLFIPYWPMLLIVKYYNKRNGHLFNYKISVIFVM